MADSYPRALPRPPRCPAKSPRAVRPGQTTTLQDPAIWTSTLPRKDDDDLPSRTVFMQRRASTPDPLRASSSRRTSTSNSSGNPGAATVSDLDLRIATVMADASGAARSVSSPPSVHSASRRKPGAVSVSGLDHRIASKMNTGSPCMSSRKSAHDRDDPLGGSSHHSSGTSVNTSRPGVVSVSGLDHRIASKSHSFPKSQALPAPGAVSSTSDSRIAAKAVRGTGATSVSVSTLDDRIAQKTGLPSQAPTLAQRIAAKLAGNKRTEKSSEAESMSQLDDRIQKKTGIFMNRSVHENQTGTENESTLLNGNVAEGRTQPPLGVAHEVRRPSLFRSQETKQNVREKEAGGTVAVCGKIVSKKLLCCCSILLLAVIGLAGGMIPLLLKEDVAEMNSPMFPSSALLAVCQDDSDCDSGICYRARCRSDPKEADLCDRHDVCTSRECGPKCFDANHGEDCQEDADCDGNHCDASINKCRSGDVGSLCVQGEECLTGLCSDRQTCELQKEHGDACSRDEECESGVCVLGTCSDGRAGGACGEDSHCRSGSCSDSVCHSGPEGSFCDRDEDCQSLLCRIHVNQCGPRKALGNSCLVDDNCASQKCGFNTCTDGQFDAPCSQNSHCNGGFCLDRKCAANPPGYHCNEDAGCTTYMCGVDGLCLPPLALGEECTDDRTCETKFCSGVCEKRREEGEECTKNTTCSSLMCDVGNNTCLRPWGAGGKCEFFNPDHQENCGPGLFCPKEEICRPILLHGDICRAEDICEPGTACLEVSYLCGDPLPNGAGCSRDIECSSQNCDGPASNSTCKEKLYDVPYPFYG